ncbi:hypothetical protein FACS1894120_3780 [Clostridia bacterium]|nr:hypothetical protein FACS1894120_3780 [Clostridia bacterium]
MSEFLTEIVKGLVTDPSQISVTERAGKAETAAAENMANAANLAESAGSGDGVTAEPAVNIRGGAPMVVYHLSVAESDMGRVIGKHGRIAHAIRTVMRQAGQVQTPPIHAVIEIG